MKTYLVGGWVRDWYRQSPSEDKDWVVIGATAEELEQQGFIPIRASFPVFLHPKTKEEYALARKETKVGVGHQGFDLYADPTISLEEDLLRRDLTINAMAFDPDTQSIIDPFGGRSDWDRGILRHVSPAFRDDPLRLVRLARFFAIFPNTSIAQETLDLCREIVASGELAFLSAERLRLELEKMYRRSACPQRFWQALVHMNALEAVFNCCKKEVHLFSSSDYQSSSAPLVEAFYDLFEKNYLNTSVKNLFSYLKFTQDEIKMWAILSDLLSLSKSEEDILDFILKHRCLHQLDLVESVYNFNKAKSFSWSYEEILQRVLLLKSFSPGAILENTPAESKKSVLRDYYLQLLKKGSL